MIRNLAKLAIEGGGSVTPLIIPSSLTDGTGLCNPAINKIDGELKLNLRHVKYTLYHSEQCKFPLHWGPLSYLNREDDIKLRTINYLCDVDSKTLAIKSLEQVDTTKLDVKPLWDFVGLEDARLVKWDNKEYLCGVRRDTTTNGEGRIEFSEIKDGKEINRYRIQMSDESVYCEKNWMPINDMPFHFVKWSNPTEVVKVNLETLSSEVVHLNTNSITTSRDLRGSSHVIKYKNHYIAVTHEVDLWYNEQNQKDTQYYHRFVVWDENWNMVNITDEFKFFDAGVEFVCGMVEHEDNLLISLGFQDNAAYIVQLPNEVFDSILDKTELPKSKSCNVKTHDLLYKFTMDTLNPTHNFNLGQHYFLQDQYASALSFFLRVAEYGDDKDMIYESLMKVAQCIHLTKGRDSSTKTAFQNAINFLPERPEAYLLLSMFHESKLEWFDSHTLATIALSFKHNLKSTLTDIGAGEEYKIYFQLAVTNWWVGKGDISRKMFLDLVHNNQHELSDYYARLINKNIKQLHRYPHPHFKYTALDHSNLKYKFKDSKLVKSNYSQTYQDMFVLAALNGKKNGTYLEIGASDPEYGNNTMLLEEKFGWTGMSVEILEHEVEKFKKVRKNPIHLGDATKINYWRFIKMSGFSKNIDYLQLDCDPPSVTYDILTKIPFDEYKFAVITYEHDHYADETSSYRDKSRKYLESKGYKLVVSNISPDDNSPFEDWWVHPDLVDLDTINKLSSIDEETKNAEVYMLGLS